MTDKLDIIILSYALREKRFMVELSKSVKPEYFATPGQQLFYQIILTNFQDPMIRDIISEEALFDYAIENSLEKKSKELKIFYSKLKKFTLKSSGMPPADEDFGYYLKKIKGRYNVKIIGDFGKDAADAVNNGSSPEELNKILSDATKTISSINQIEVFDEGSVADDVKSMWQEYESIQNNPNEFRGVLSGIPSLDNITNGFQGGELIIIAGMEGTGKSILMHNIGVNAWLGTNKPGKTHVGAKTFAENGHNVLYFTLEMPRSNRGEITSGGYLNKRVLSCVSGVKFEEIRKGTLDSSNRDKLKKACDFIEDYSSMKQFYVVDIPRGAKVEDIEVKYLELSEKMNIDLIIIDYLGIMAGDDDSDWEAQGHIAGGLHELARSYNVPVLTAVQLNRPQGVQSLDKQKYNNARVSRSAMITQNANMVMQIGCRDNEEVYPDMPLYITKMRDGNKGQLSLTKAFESMTILDGSPVTSSDELDEFGDFSTMSEASIANAMGGDREDTDEFESFGDF